MNKPTDFVANTLLTMDKNGELCVYLSDVLINESTDDCRKAVGWACEVVNNEELEHTLSLNIDIPASVERIIDFYNEGDDGEIVITASCRPNLDALKAKLEAAVAIFDRIKYVE